jgi:hypothetical protein
MFHPDIRTALAQAPELMAVFAAKSHKHAYSDITVAELGLEDLDTITTPGNYGQSQNTDAATAANYPTPFAGYLTVRGWPTGNGFVFQEYTTYTTPIRKFTRTKYSTGAFTAWVEGQPLIAAGTTAQYYRGDKTWQTLNKTAVGLNLVDNVSVVSDYVPKWKANTAYTAGQQVISPRNEVVSSKTARTSGATWDATELANWSGIDRMMTLYNSGFAWSGGITPWDAGPFTIDVAGSNSQVTSGANFAAPGSVSGTIKFLEPGLYDVFWYNIPSADPGTSGYRINASSTGVAWALPTDAVLMGAGYRTGGDLYWEVPVPAIGIRVTTANQEIRLQGVQSNGSTNRSQVKIIQRGRI